LQAVAAVRPACCPGDGGALPASHLGAWHGRGALAGQLPRPDRHDPQPGGLPEPHQDGAGAPRQAGLPLPIHGGGGRPAAGVGAAPGRVHGRLHVVVATGGPGSPQHACWDGARLPTIQPAGGGFAHAGDGRATHAERAGGPGARLQDGRHEGRRAHCLHRAHFSGGVGGRPGSASRVRVLMRPPHGQAHRRRASVRVGWPCGPASLVGRYAVQRGGKPPAAWRKEC